MKLFATATISFLEAWQDRAKDDPDKYMASIRIENERTGEIIRYNSVAATPHEAMLKVAKYWRDMVEEKALAEKENLAQEMRDAAFEYDWSPIRDVPDE